MAHTHHDLSHEVTRMRPAGKMLGVILMAAGLLAVVAAYLVSPRDADGHLRRFWFAYLFGLCAIASVSCASLVFTLVNHLVRAGWITNVRRILETMALQLVLVLVLTLPILVVVLMRDGTIYSWAKPGNTPVVHHGHHDDHGEAHGAHAGGHYEGDGHDHGHEGHPGHATTAPHGPATQPAGGHPDAPMPAGHAAAGAPAHDHTHDHAHGTAAETKHAGHNDPHAESENAHAIAYPNEQVQPGVQRAFDHNIAHKNHTWLNPTFWALRVFAYLAVLSGIAYFYWSSSVKQDATGDLDISDRLFTVAAPMTLVTGLITTFIAFDVFMSLDPHWFSTMYGVYFFASGTQAMWAIISLFVLALQSRGYLKQSITTEHRHDLGKFLWAFIFFWGYIAFSQYMLQWYASLPEETFFFDKRGYSQSNPNGYTPLVIALVAGRFVIPFLGLLSRHVKRNRFGLGFWSVWLLAFFVVDIYLLVLPEYSWTPLIGLPEILAFGGIAALWLGNMIRVLGNHELRAVRDPRVHESLALQNF